MAKPKKTYHHGDLRNSLLVAGESLLEKKGVAAVSLRELAKEAGVSHTAPYRHFSDKAALLNELGTIQYSRLADEMDRCVAEFEKDPAKQLSAAASAYVNLAINHPQMTNLIFGGVLNNDNCSDELSEQSERAFQGVLNVIKNGQAVNLYIEKDTQELALFVWSQVHGFSMLLTAGQLGEAADDEQAINHLMNSLSQMVIEGIGREK